MEEPNQQVEVVLRSPCQAVTLLEFVRTAVCPAVSMEMCLGQAEGNNMPCLCCLRLQIRVARKLGLKLLVHKRRHLRQASVTLRLVEFVQALVEAGQSDSPVPEPLLVGDLEIQQAADGVLKSS